MTKYEKVWERKFAEFEAFCAKNQRLPAYDERVAGFAMRSWVNAALNSEIPERHLRIREVISRLPQNKPTVAPKGLKIARFRSFLPSEELIYARYDAAVARGMVFDFMSHEQHAYILPSRHTLTAEELFAVIKPLEKFCTYKDCESYSQYKQLQKEHAIARVLPSCAQVLAAFTDFSEREYERVAHSGYPIPHVQFRVQATDAAKVYHSERVENSLTTMEEVTSVLAGAHIRNKRNEEEIIAHKSALGYRRRMGSVTVKEVLRLHSILMSPYPSKYPGRFRPMQVYINGATTTPPPPADVERLLDDCLKMADPIRQHCEFIRIHPFADGNGRMARLLTGHLIPEECQLEYFQCMDVYALTGSTDPFRALVNAIQIY